MSVADKLASVLTRFGRPMTLRRNTLGPNNTQYPLDVTVYGTTENYTPNELIGGAITQGDTKVTITGTEMTAAQWPAPPKTGDKIIIDGKPRNVGSVEPKYFGSEVLVYVLQVTG